MGSCWTLLPPARFRSTALTGVTQGWEAIRWLDELGDPYMASAYDADGRVGIDWGVYGAPETFLIDPEGTVVYKHLGPLDSYIWQREFVSRMTPEGARP